MFVPSGSAFEPTRTVSLPAPLSIVVFVCDGFGGPKPGTWKPYVERTSTRSSPEPRCTPSSSIPSYAIPCEKSKTFELPMPRPVAVEAVTRPVFALESPLSSMSSWSSPPGCVGDPPWTVSSASMWFTLRVAMIVLIVCVAATFRFGVAPVSANEPATKEIVAVPVVNAPVNA